MFPNIYKRLVEYYKYINRNNQQSFRQTPNFNITMFFNMLESLNDYYKYLSCNNERFFCSYCGVLMYAKEYEEHCSQHHELNSKVCCVWCCGTESWESDEKHMHVDHLTTCFNRFYMARLDPTHPRLIDLTPTCSKVESFFYHSTSIRELLPLRAFQSIWPPENLPTPPITFQGENLNLAASYLQLYLETRDTHDWMHVMVKAVAMESFLRALDHDNGRTRVLEFWCWCDGGRVLKDELRQHRHMIAMSEHPKGRFKSEIWPRVRVEPSPRPNFPIKRFKMIKSPLHFINTLGCLTKQESECAENPTHGKENHFYIYKTLPKGFKFALATMWPDGAEELLEQEKFEHVSIPRLIEVPWISEKSQQKPIFKEFFNLKQRLVIPVEKRFAPTTEITPHFIHLTRYRKLYFKPSPKNESLTQDLWLQMQFEGGNALNDIVCKEIWILIPTNLSRINDTMPLVNNIEYLESNNKELKMENEKLKSEIEELKKEIEEMICKNEELRCDNNELKNDMEVFEKKMEELKSEKEELESENDVLKSENVELKKKLEDVEKNTNA